MNLTIRQNTFGSACHGLWYISNGYNNHLHKDLKIHKGTGYFAANFNPNNAQGYYKSKEEAERYLMAYRVKGMKFIVRQCRHWPERGWYIITDTGAGYRKERFVWRDLELHEGTGFGAINYNVCGAPGYYNSRCSANYFLKLFKEKQNMAEKIEVHLTVNDVVTPLHEISKETMLKIREASKPKPIPAFQVAESALSGPRLIFKVTEDIANRIGEYVGLESDGIVGASFEDMADVDHYYRNRCELKLEDLV